AATVQNWKWERILPELRSENMKETIVWSVLFVLGLVMVLFRMDISRYLSDITALLVTGSILSVFSGAGMLMEWYKDKQ
ncbi:MAG: hypothetical protein IJ282_11620, partial [Lachnospiraceae bacterium]|nr:hypothetical protein [Lachnospiraceae bacterium]